jgi:hypothetical protein
MYGNIRTRIHHNELIRAELVDSNWYRQRADTKYVLHLIYTLSSSQIRSVANEKALLKSMRVSNCVTSRCVPLRRGFPQRFAFPTRKRPLWYTPPAPMNHVRIFKGWPPRDALSKLVKLWYRTFPPDQRHRVVIHTGSWTGVCQVTGTKRRFNRKSGRSRFCQSQEIKYIVRLIVCICVCVCMEREKER